MDVELAAVEDDVERKRVGRNPFDEKFTSLTESSFTDATAAGNGEQEMETISRHIITRMEVIGKQIAFLSKETAGQPHKILAGIRTAAGKSSGTGAAEGTGAGASSEGRDGGGTGDQSPPGGDGADGGSVRMRGPSIPTTTSPLGAPLPTRVDLHRRIRQGLVRAEDLLPETMLAAAKAFSSCGRVSPADTPPASAATAGGAADDGGAAPISRTTHDGRDDNAAERAAPPPGVLHSFIKHVKPFSVRFDAVPTSSSFPSPSAGPTTTTAEADARTRSAARTTASAASAAPAAAGGEEGEGGGDENHADNLCDYGGGEDATFSPPDDGVAFPARRETPVSSRRSDRIAAPPAAGGVAHDGGSETTGRQLGASRTERGGGGGGGPEALRRTNAPERKNDKGKGKGKRKLGQSWPPSPSPPLSPRSNGAGQTSSSASGHGGSAGSADRERGDGDQADSGDGGRGRGGAAANSPRAKRPPKKTEGKAAGSRPLVGVVHGPTGNGSTGTRAGVHGRGGARGRGAGGNGGGNGGDRAGRSSLSWSSAKRLRERMEAATAAGQPSTGTAGVSTKGGRSGGGGGGRKGGGAGRIKTTLSDPVAARSAGGAGKGTAAPGSGMASGFGALPLVRSNAYLQVPAAAGVETYLASLANPSRNLAAMKRAFQDKPRAARADGDEAEFSSPAPPPSAFEGCQRQCPSPASSSGSFDFDLGPGCGHQAGAATGAGAGAAEACEQGRRSEDTGKGDTLASTPIPRPSTQARGPTIGAIRSLSPVSKPSRFASAVQDVQESNKPGLGGYGTCVVDLTNIWRRAGVVAQEISQANVKQSGITKGLRESFARLDLQHQEKQRHHEKQEQERPTVRPTNCDAGAGEGGEEEEEGRRTRPIDVETSMSVSLRYPSQGAPTAQPRPKEAPTVAGVAHGIARGGEEGAARMFALVVSLAHVHNISAVAGGGGAGGSSGRSAGPRKSMSSQLYVELGSGGHEAIVTAKTV